ncbi:hypothetical protein Q5692_17455 [Microcoleus sp. C2C3]|uniref:hypothetical protein n=1 Tax=unclassified Microcoleus TaxID=2642155 RepID=UPI002FD486BD
MSGNKKVTKEQILKALEQLEKNPNDKMGILGDIGIVGVGAVLGAGAAGTVAAAAGATAIPIVTTVGSWLGLSLLGATPVGWVVGTAAAGAAIAYGVSRLTKGGGYNEAKQAEILKQLKEQLREVETKERASKLGESDKTKFIVSLKEPIELNLISPQDAQDLIRAVESGQIPIKEAINMVKAIVEAAKPQ